jgi:hypothetical protein
MKTATRLLMCGSLLAAGCSGEAGNGEADLAMPDGSTDPGAGVPVLDASGNPVLDASGNPVTMPPIATPVGDPPVTPPDMTAPGDTTTLPGDPPVDPGPTEVTPPPDTGTCQLGVPVTSQIPRLTNLQYDTVIGDIFDVAPASGSWSASFEPDSKGELSNTQWAQYQSQAEEIAAAVLATPLGEELTTAAADPTALEASVRSLGRRMFRRPLTDDEVASFMTLMAVQPAGTPAEIAEAVVYTMLISPSFLMRTELDAPEEMVPGTDATPQMAFKLSSHEVASRLSFLIWNSVPDPTLDAAADADELQTPEQIQAQAARMVGAEFRDKVTPVIIAAHRFYANIDENSSVSRWGKTPHDATRFPEYSEAQNATLLAEMDSIFAEVGFEGQFADLFLSNVAYVNQDTARLYGVEGEFGPELVRVELTGTERPGFLTRGAFLSSFAHERDTSPILRGAFILSLMGAELGIPDPAFARTELPPGDYMTNREAVTALTSVETECVSCHQLVINPPGFVLENFSAVGSIQTTDPEYGGTIDTAVESVAFPDGAKPINNAFELMTELAAGSVAKQIYARKWVAYATGRDANDFDECTASTIAAKMAGAYPLASVLADVTQAESFRYRVAAP